MRKGQCIVPKLFREEVTENLKTNGPKITTKQQGKKELEFESIFICNGLISLLLYDKTLA